MFGIGDVGDWICRPFVDLIPPSVTPNSITLVNHAANWVMFGLCAYGGASTEVVLTAAVINFGCMMLDCLDGMHARNTQQCSKSGEVLDHVMDAAHCPLVTGSAALLVGMPTPFVIGSTALSAVTYGCQMLHFRFEGEFVPTIGVEGQIACSLLMALSAYRPVWAAALSYLGPLVCLGMCYPYVRVMSLIAALEVIEMIVVQSAIAVGVYKSLLSVPGAVAMITLHSLVKVGRHIIEGVEQSKRPRRSFDGTR